MSVASLMTGNSNVMYCALTGKFSSEDNLLHLCMHQRLEETAIALLQPQCVDGKESYILQEAALDNCNPLDIARKHGMKKAMDLAQMAVVRDLPYNNYIQ